MASSASPSSSEPYPKPLDPCAVSFQPTTTYGGGHRQTREPICPSDPLHLAHEFYKHPRHGFRPPPRAFFCPQPLPSLYPPPPSPPVCYYVFSGNFCWFNPQLQPPVPSNQLSPDESRFHQSSTGVGKPVAKLRRRGRPTRKLWVPRNAPQKNAGGRLPQTTTEDAEAKLMGKTSLMIRNIPNQFERKNLERILDEHCSDENTKDRSQAVFCESAYDFLYLPMDFGFKLNVGFAFVNFTSAKAALLFYKKFNNTEWSFGDKKKICEICPANVQGRNALKKRFEKSVFECDNKEYLPVVYSPPRGGSIRSTATTVGRCTGRARARDGIMIMTRRRERNSRGGSSWIKGGWD